MVFPQVSKIEGGTFSHVKLCHQQKSISTWLTQALGLCTLLSGVSVYAVVVSNDGSEAESTVTSQVVPSKMVYLHGFSFSPEENGAYDFKVAFTAAEMMWLNQLKLDTATDGYSAKAAAGPVLIPINCFDICLDANVKNFTGTVQLKASVSAGDFRGTENTGSTIKSYVLLHGNDGAVTTGQTTAANRDLLIGSEADAIQGFLNTTAITQANLTLVTGTPATAAAAIDDNPWVKPTMSNVATYGKVTDTTATGIKHYGIEDQQYTLTANENDTTNSQFKVDVTDYAANMCGTGNVAVMQACVYLDIRDLVGNPADTYTGNIGIDFSY